MIIEKQLSRFQHKINYLIVVITIFAVSPFFSSISNYYLFGLLIFLLIVALKRKNTIINQKIFLLIFFVYILIFIQSFLYKGYSIAALYYPLITFYLPFLLYKIFGISFFRYFIKILYFVAIYTTPIWFLQSVLPPFDNFLQQAINLVFPISWSSSPRSLLFYTAAWGDVVYNSDLGIYRNSGIFHEPGAYAVFLNLGIVLNTFLSGKRFDKKNIIFIFCILTTLSTAGYITLFIILSSFLWKQKMPLFLKITTIIIFFLISFQTYKSEEFLQSKIQSQYEDQVESAENQEGRFKGKSGRFFAFYTGFQKFLENPLAGRGIIFKTSEKATGEMHMDSSYTYGLMGMLATYGLFFGLMFGYYFYRGFLILTLLGNQKHSYAFVAFVAMNLELSSQVFITSTIFILIFIFGYQISYSKGKKQIQNVRQQ